MGRFVRILAVAAWVIALPSALFAQGTISGTVKDTSGAVLPGVTVEAASPVLIEKVRSAVTDGNGRYQIIDLRPGAYTVTFTLAGFNTFRRDNVTVSGSAAAGVDAELRVGALEETITVTGEAPVVDTTSVTKQQVLNSEMVDALPTARNYFGLARMIPGTSGGGNDVGGSLIQDVGQSVTVHGSRNTDQRITANGLNTMTLQAGGNIGGQTPDLGSAAEVTVDTTSLGADLPTGGIRVNFVPRDGGNRFTDSTFFTFANESLQGDNFSDELRAAGLTTPNKVLMNWDLNQSIGGPIKRDKVWFWFSTRLNQTENEVPVLINKNAFNVNEWTYAPDQGNPAVAKGQQYNNSIRVTWQATPKVKVAGTYKADKWCNCPSDITATRAFEASRDRRFPRLMQEHGEVTSPVTNKLLFEAVGLHLFERWGDMHLRSSTGSLTEAQEALLPQLISVTDQRNSLVYRGRATNNNTQVPNWTYRAAMSYVTGTHAVKFGFNRVHGYLNEYQYAMNPLSYRVNTTVDAAGNVLTITPNQLTMQARPYRSISNLDNDLGLFVQDRWSMERLTLNLALRFDNFSSSFPEQTLGATPFTPTRNITFPEQDNLAWKDITYRSGLAYDIFGTGKTALKVAFNKYLLGQTLNGIGRDPNPVLALATSTNRSWTDNDRDFFPDCDLLNPLAQGPTTTGSIDTCGAFSESTFGTTRPAAKYDPDLLTGWGHRPANWEFSTSVQHELARGIAVDVGYFRRVWKNFQVTDNLLLGPSDYTYFDMKAPVDERLGDVSGSTITGLRNVVPAKFGLAEDYNTLSDKYGKQIDHWNGVDVSLNGRLQNGLTFQAGVSTGKQIEDNCEVVAQLPELNSGNNMRPLGYCHREEPMMTQFKGYGVYTLPKVDVQVSGTFRSTPGATVNANYTATNAYLASSSTLGRTLSGGAANISVALLSPNTKYLDRRNELDVRFGKVLRFGRARSVVSLDLFNALNSNALITANEAYATWLAPTQILNARLMKFSVQFDF